MSNTQGWTAAELAAVRPTTQGFPTECRACGAGPGESCQHPVCHYPLTGKGRRPLGQSMRCEHAHPCPHHGAFGRYKTPLYCAGRPRMVGGVLTV